MSQPVPSITQDTSSQHSSDDVNSEGAVGGGLANDSQAGGECAIDDEDIDHYDMILSRSSSMTSLHSRAMTSEEGHIHRLGQNIRRDFLSPSLNQSVDHLSSSFFDESHVMALREKLERLQGEQMVSSFDTVGADKAIEGLGLTVDELWDTQRRDAEGFAMFKQSQIAAQINGGIRKASSTPEHGHETSRTTGENNTDGGV